LQLRESAEVAVKRDKVVDTMGEANGCDTGVVDFRSNNCGRERQVAEPVQVIRPLAEKLQRRRLEPGCQLVYCLLRR
jgi:hypothetical protein